MFKVKHERINQAKPVGRGGSGVVYAYAADENDLRYVVKIMRASDIKSLQTILQEIVIGYNCDHPSILPIRGFCLEEQKYGTDVFVKMPRMKESLRDVLKRKYKTKEFFSFHTLLKYLYTLLSGLEYLAGKKIAHRDIKPENILISFEEQAKLADVGGAKVVEAEDETNFVSEVIGTRAYLAPEANEKRKNMKKNELQKTDLWSLGVVMVELIALEPWDKSLTSIPEEILIGKLEKAKERYDQRFLDLIKALLKTNPAERGTAKEVRERLEEVFREELDEESSSEKFEAQKEEFEIEKKKDGEDLQKQEKEKEEEDGNKMSKSQKKMKEGFFTQLTQSLFGNKNSNEGDAEAQERRSSFSNTFDETIDTSEKWIDYFTVKAGAFDISFLNKEKVTDNRVKAFMANMQKRLDKPSHLAIETVSIDLSNCREITSNSLGAIATTIGQYTPRLHTLKLNFSDCRQLKDKGLEYINKKLSNRLSSLTCFELALNNIEEISNTGFKSIASDFLQNYRNLSHLELHFYGCYKITDDAVSLLANTLSTKLDKLGRFAITLNYCDGVTDKGINDLAASLALHQFTLHHLDLNFVNCQTTDEGIKSIADNIGANLRNLLYLNLNFGVWDNKVNLDLKNSSSRFQENSLSSVNYRVRSNKKVSGESIQKLFTQMKDNIQRLEYLSINLSYFPKIIDQDVVVMAKCIGRYMKRLRHLNINLNSNFNITDAGFQVLCKEIGDNLYMLEHFRLCMWNCHQITNEGFKNFAIYIGSKLFNLRQLEADFDECKNITNLGMTQLSDSICSKLPLLRGVDLSFCKCPEISEFMKEMFKKALDNHISKVLGGKSSGNVVIRF